VHIDVSLRKKFGERAWKGVFIDYDFDSHAWLVYNPVTRRFIRSRNVVFDEEWMKILSIPKEDEGEEEVENEGTVAPDPTPTPH
jgi:hypothetical protein